MHNPAQINLLIIDDKTENLEFFKRIFLDADYNLKTTTSPDEAVKFSESNEFDLILLDIRMPVDGFSVFKMIKSTDKNNSTPVIFMAEKTDLENISKAFQIGCRDILTKPFRLDELFSKITTHSLLHIQFRQINELMSAKNKIFSVIGHDLRSPYNSLIGFSNLLLENLEKSENIEAVKYSQIINRLSVKNLELLDSLLKYAKNLEKDSSQISQKININSLISEVLHVIYPSAVLKKIRLSHEIGESSFINGKKDLIAAMIRNIVSNAIKFTNPGGFVTIKNVVAGGNVDIIISDNGIGMTENEIKSLFDYSHKSSTPGTAGEIGSGYGLLLSKEIIDKHNGTISVDSKPGAGTIFKITFPLSI